MEHSCGKYREALNPGEIALIESVCLPEIHALGLEPVTACKRLDAIPTDAIDSTRVEVRKHFPGEREPEV